MGRRSLPLHAAAVISVVLAAPLGATERIERFCGYAYGLDDGRYRYTEVHEQVLDDESWLRGSITYIAPDGSSIGRKTLSFNTSPFIPAYRLSLFGGAYLEGIENVGKERVSAFRKRENESAPELKRVKYTSPAAADSGFHALIQARLDKIIAEGEQRFDFIVAGALDRFRFRVRKVGDTQFEGRPAVKLIAEPDSLLSWFVDELELTYDPVSRRLLEYRGPTNLREPETGNGYDVRIVFASAVPVGIPPAAAGVCGQ